MTNLGHGVEVRAHYPNFSWFWLIFCYPDPDPVGWNETDPNTAKNWIELKLGTSNDVVWIESNVNMNAVYQITLNNLNFQAFSVNVFL